MPSKSAESFALEVVQTLRNCDFTAFFAGGCVRDQLLGRPAKDYDVATAARPEEVRKVFGRRRTLAIGASFGVITVLGPKPLQVEVATFRSDGHYSDGRHPDGVTFSSAQEDAARRDFTINGMFYDPIHRRVIDYVGGQDDLKAGLIRAIGEPVARITEDRLRMLRAVRFAATYGFQIEPDTMAAVQSQAEHLSVVSQERITAELLRMLSHPNRSRAMSLLRDSHLLPLVLPPFQSDFSPPRWSRLLRILDTDFESPLIALAAILGETGLELNPRQVRDLCHDLKLSNDQTKAVCWIHANLQHLHNASNLPWSELQPLLIQQPARLALDLMRSVAQVDNEDLHAWQKCQDFLAQPPALQDPPPLVRGEDLMQAGFKPGPMFSKVLGEIRASQLDGKLHSREEALALAEQIIEEAG